MKIWAGNVIRVDMSGTSQMCPHVDVADFLQRRALRVSYMIFMYFLINNAFTDNPLKTKILP